VAVDVDNCDIPEHAAVKAFVLHQLRRAHRAVFRIVGRDETQDIIDQHDGRGDVVLVGSDQLPGA
jgi:hypothetical protein